MPAMGTSRALSVARAGWVLGALALTAAASSALAAEPSKMELAAARDLFSRAERDEEAGRWTDALDKVRRAGTVKMTPGIRFHIALCEEKLGQLVSALGDYASAEAAARAEGNKDVLDAVTDSLTALRARTPTLTLTPPPDAKDAVVTLDGTALSPGLLGTPIPVDVGVHAVQAHASGRPPFAMTVSVFERQAASVVVRLPAAAPAGVAPAGVAPVPATPAGAPERLTPAPSSPVETAHETSPPKTLAILTSAGAAALVGFGIASYFIAGGQQSSAETACLERVSCDSLKSGPRTWDALALGAWIAGASVAGLSVYLWTRPASPAEAPPRAALLFGPGSLELRGRF
jgi:hypothetical protein